MSLSARITEMSLAGLAVYTPEHVGEMIRVTDLPGKTLFVRNERSVWRPMMGEALLSQADARVNVAGGAAETIVWQFQLPAGFLQINDRLQLWPALSKAGGTTATVGKIRVGTAGTVADTTIITGNMLATASLSAGLPFDVKVMSATSLQVQGAANAATGSYGGATNTAYNAAVTISNISNALWVSLTLTPGATDATALEDLRLKLIAGN